MNIHKWWIGQPEWLKRSLAVIGAVVWGYWAYRMTKDGQYTGAAIAIVVTAGQLSRVFGFNKFPGE